MSVVRSRLPADVALVAVSKTMKPEVIMEAYNAGHRVFGENRVQELLMKQPLLPDDIEWHFIGHLQTNKVKYVVPVASLIHSADSTKLVDMIDKEAFKAGRKVGILLQVRIALEETKFGMSADEASLVAGRYKSGSYGNVMIKGLMGMATLTGDREEIRREFAFLSALFSRMKESLFPDDGHFSILSMGMSDDYDIAVETGANMVRIGSLIFGHRANT